MMILLTGATGFIGHHLYAALCSLLGEENVVVLSSKPHAHSNSITYEWQNLNFSDKKFKAVECVIHAGAFTPKKGSEANDIARCNQNITFTQLLINALPAIKKFVFLSSIDVYGQATDIVEVTPPAPMTLYGWSKVYCEQMVRCGAEQKDIAGTVLRIGHVYGPGEQAYQKIIPIAIKKALLEEDVEIWGDGTDLRSYIYVADVVKACIAAIQCDDLPQCINVAGSQPISIVDLVHKIIDLTGKAVGVTHIPSKAPKRDSVFDNSLLKKYLLQRETSLDAGLQDEINEFKGKS